ncbi:MAG: 50S ribosomal protein L34e [Candidatus Nanoarchaeia archaeon]
MVITMPRGMYRSRTLRRKDVKTPGGKTVRRYKQRKPHVAHCGRCGAKLQGIPRIRASLFAKLTKSQKRPERPYGGVLCSRCLRDVIKTDTRNKGE